MNISKRSRFPTPPEARRLLFANLFGATDTAFRLQRLGDGVLAILGHVRELAAEVDILVTAGRSARARFLLVTADEELGKAHLLIDVARLDVKHEGTLRRLAGAFYDHVAKYAYMRAWRHRNVIGARPYGANLGHLFACDLIEWWPGDQEGVPGLPHDTVFSRDAKLYVDYSDSAIGGWIVSDPREDDWNFGIEPFLGDRRADTREHLAAFEALSTGGALSHVALEALHQVWCVTTWGGLPLTPLLKVCARTPPSRWRRTHRAELRAFWSRRSPVALLRLCRGAEAHLVGGAAGWRRPAASPRVTSTGRTVATREVA